ncbi:MAG: hypothetical protein GY821_05930 [Gammaproteobacteria bacterium]|nr:hypothetical protein [Gammaproteobacteria bacterium]
MIDELISEAMDDTVDDDMDNDIDDNTNDSNYTPALISNLSNKDGLNNLVSHSANKGLKTLREGRQISATMNESTTGITDRFSLTVKHRKILATNYGESTLETSINNSSTSFGQHNNRKKGNDGQAVVETIPTNDPTDASINAASTTQQNGNDCCKFCCIV